MVFTNKLSLFCLNSVLRRYRRPCETSELFVGQLKCEFSSKKSNIGKNIPKITVTAKNDLHNKQRSAFEQKTHEKSPNGSTFVHHKHGRNQPINQSKNIGKKCTIGERRSKASRNISETIIDSDSDDDVPDELDVPNWKTINTMKVNKTFYAASKVTENRSIEEINEFLIRMHITVDRTVPKPIFKFSELNDLSQQILATIESRGYAECTSIQSQGLPIALGGSNMLAIAQSGSGKSLAMILSALVHILHQPPADSADGPIAMILASTSEMAEEIRQLANDFCRDVGIACTVLIDKASESTEIGQLCIATPDCLYDTLRGNAINLSRCSHLALYESNMIDLCLEEEILQIMSQVRPDCQRLIWSTAWNSELKVLAMDIFSDFVRLDVRSSAATVDVAQNVRQIVKISQEKKKEKVFVEFLDAIGQQAERRKTLVFTETPEMADTVAKILLKKGLASKSMHNGKVLRERNEILSSFYQGAFQYLVLTDLAAKNVIFDGISNVVHFDMPISIREYILRVNRTGRSAETGNSFAIITEDDGHLADDLIRLLQQTNS